MRVYDSDELKGIGDICNYYGGLQIVERDGKYWWGIENWDGTELSEIPKYLFDALNKFDSESTND